MRNTFHACDVENMVLLVLFFEFNRHLYLTQSKIVENTLNGMNVIYLKSFGQLRQSK